MRAIVTGAARGIGAVVAKGLMREGWRVACLDLRDELGQAVAGEGEGRFIHCDIADKAAVDASFAAAVAWLGGLDLLVAAAGLDKPGHAPEDITEAAWDLVMGINAKGTFLTNQAAFRAMQAGGGGAIVNFGSLAGLRGTAERAAYSAAKAAVAGWSRAAAQAWGPSNVTVNVIAPTMHTEVAEKYLDGLGPEARAAFEAERTRITPMGRLGDVAADLLPLVLLLAGPGGRYITGQTLSVDGGRTMLGA
ncbi:MAG TPA: SDR family oxidoreductase [Allosphingosinicella sp.]|nr:SDR family oxidoreductase [Allosphingosinicella sp.]